MRSPRMRDVLALLMLRGPEGATTKEIADLCHVASARDYIRRLRDHGNPISTVEAGTSKAGARIVRYILGQRDLFEERSR